MTPGGLACPAMVGPRLSAAGGVVVSGIDLSQPLSQSQNSLILGAFRDHHVVVFHNQFLTREQQYNFSANFGPVESSESASSPNKRHGVAHVISNLGPDGNPVDRSSSPVSNYRWHTDKAYHPKPPLMTTLYAVQVPKHGGDTEFANTALAYAALPEQTKQFIDGLSVVFRWGSGYAQSGDLPAALTYRRQPAVHHPLVRRHPDTGLKALYLGNHASHISELPEAEGRALLEKLLTHAIRRRFVLVHRWRDGDLVMWDNRCLLHRAVANYETGREKRVLHRTVVADAVAG